jgi:hypothetical protein
MNDILNRRNYVRWIAVCSIPALVKMVGKTVIEISYETIAGKHQTLIENTANLLTLGYYLLFAYALYRALRHFAPQLTLRRWMATMFVSVVLYALSYIPVIYPIHLQPTDWDESITALTYSVYVRPLLSNADSPLHSMRLLHFLISSAICFVLLPAWVLGKYSTLKRSQFFWAAAVTAIAAFSLSVLFRFISFDFPMMQPDGCEPSVIGPIVNAITDCIAGAIGAVLGCVTLAALVRRGNPVRVLNHA